MTLHTPEIPPPPRVPTRTDGRASWRARAPQWAIGVAAVVTALGGAAGLRALFGQGEEQIRQSARIEATLQRLVEDRASDRARLDALEHRERQNFQRNEGAFAVLFAAGAKQGYEPPREAPAGAEQVRFVPTKNAKRPVLPAEQSGQALALPAPATPPGVTQAGP